MKKLLALLGMFAALCVSASATTITASHIQQDASGVLLPTGYLCAQPELNGQPSGFTVGNGTILPAPVCSAVTNGVLGSMTLADTSLAIPAVGYVLQVQTAGHQPLYTIGTAFPTGSTWSLDSFSINVTTPAPAAGIFYGTTVPQTRCTAPSIYYTPSQTDECVNQVWVAETTSSTSSSSGSGSARVIYTSALLGSTGDALVAAGTSTPGTDKSAAIQAALTGGNVQLVVDGQYGLNNSLVLSSNTKISCLAGDGFVLEPGLPLPMFINQHVNAATTASGTGFGYLVSNITDHDIDIGGDGKCTFNLGSQPRNDANGRWDTATRLLGIQNLHVSAQWVNAATYSVLYSNVLHGIIEHNWIDHTDGNGSDGIHGNGPLEDVQVSDTRCTADLDDCVAFNADDGQETRLADANQPYVDWPGWLQGPIQDSSIRKTFLDAGSTTGIRLLSVSERIDNIDIDDVGGATGHEVFTLSHEYAGSAGLGNFGRVSVSNIHVADSMTGGFAARNCIFYIGGNFENLSINGYKESQRVGTWPAIWFVDGTIQNFQASGWSIVNTTGTDSDFIDNLGSTINNFSFNNLSWSDATGHTGTFFEGSAPNTLTLSNYAGPNGATRLFATGFSVNNKNGDAFTNAYIPPQTGDLTPCPAGSTCYLQTTFNEFAAGYVVAGTAPAVTATGHTWAGGSSWGYLGGTGGIGTASNDLISYDTGHANEVIRANVKTITLNQIGVRYLDAGDQVAINFNANGAADAYDIGAGASADICTIVSGGNGSGLVAITLNGSAISISYNGQSCTGTTQNLTGTLTTINNYESTSYQLSSMSIASQ